MKPVAPLLAPEVELPSLQSEIRALCESKAAHDRATIPAPPSADALRAATPVPPADDDASRDTLPSPPPPSAVTKAEDSPRPTEPVCEDDPTPKIPGPPRLPRTTG